MTTEQLIQEALKRYEKEVDKLDDDTGYWDHDFVKDFLTKELSTIASKVAEEEKEEERLGIVAFCKNCKMPRMIIDGLCPGCLKHGSIVFDSEIKILDIMMNQ